jgi:uncharacterized membrane protein YfcA
MIDFPVSGVETYWWFPLLTALVVSSIASTGGLSGAFLLLPYQISILGYVNPGVSATNLVYNVVSIPSGVMRLCKERRMIWPLTLVIIAGTTPGVLVGAYLRIKYLPDPVSFKFFAGLVLLYVGIRLVNSALRSRGAGVGKYSGQPFEASVRRFNLHTIEFEFTGELYSVSVVPVFLISLVVGVIGGTYGIGGGAIIAPVLVAVYGLPVYTIAGSALMSTFVASIAGAIAYTTASTYLGSGPEAKPDIALGALLGLGGAIGVYVGSRIQKYVPARAIKFILAACVLFVAIRYVLEFLGMHLH